MQNYLMGSLENQFTKFENIVKFEFSNLQLNDLNKKPNSDSWSVLECLAHLNLYSDYYLPELKRVISKAEGSAKSKSIKWSWFGKFSVKKIAVSNFQKMKTIARMDPKDGNLSRAVIEAFLKNNLELNQISKKAANLNFNKKGIRVEFLKIVKLNLAETLVFMMEHQNRHLIQAQNVIQELKLEKAELISD